MAEDWSCAWLIAPSYINVIEVVRLAKRVTDREPNKVLCVIHNATILKGISHDY
jgi:hypothetical protein